MASSIPVLSATNRTGSDEWPSLRLYQRECGQQTFSVANLVYLQSETNYTWLNWKEGKRMLMPRTLKFYEPKLPTQFFLRLHRNCLVNARYIVGVERDETGPYVLLTTGERLSISRRRWTTIKRMVESYTQVN
ncbi:LytR/AlgR family response regulator transcription factor [Fibrella aquatica]|uniref:LytR/AlgR family response regulator transcription factor n=1 Tax=Fibrella aquatica TaxID=3242487 RepID=UPI00351F8F7A